ncbi:DUF4386 domain-containing protein [Kitasatospora sp. NPDC057223]|uniref:DUF4386 domain-containing protein n=1 Tax=Kitasatospora sp. NPDC057223 TaxID=3346055 RepID=UPI003630D4FE
MNPDRRTAMVAGVLFLVTEVAAIGGLVLQRPALGAAGRVLGPGAESRVFLGVLCEVVLVVAVVGTGVALYPVLRRRSEGLALGYVCGRLLEAAVITVGILGVLSVVTLRRDLAGAADTAPLAAAVRGLVALHEWTFLLGPNIALGLNTLLLAYLMYRTGLVPRFVAVLGLVGGPLICASAVAVMFGLYPQLSGPGSAAAVPVFAWEVALAARLVTRGFEPSTARAAHTGRVAPAPQH